MTRPILLIMAKAPRVGAVKTRLAREIGAVAAWRFHRQTLAALVHRTGAVPFWRAVLLVTPDRAQWQRRRGLPNVNQGLGDLGKRMLRGLTGFPRGTSVVLVGCDIPGVTVPILREAFHLLRAADVVFGPATDGGFWLVGFSGRRAPFRPFDHVSWSTATTLDQTLGNFRSRTVARAARLSDVDDVKSWLLARDAL